MFKVSVVVNTCALGPRAQRTLGSDGRTVPHDRRAYALRNFILPLYSAAFDEVVVVGEWESGPGYLYVPMASVFFSSADALLQRQAGFEASTGDVVLHVHDDHIVMGECVFNGDVLVPERRTRLRSAAGELLNNGAPEYISGHAALYRREVLERCPWQAVPATRTWDIEHTKQIKAAGFEVEWTSELQAWDVEEGSQPWV